MPENTVTQPKEKTQERAIVMTDIGTQTVVEANALIQAVAKMDAAPLKLFEIAVSGLDSKSDDPATTVKIDKNAIFKALDYQGATRNAWLTTVLTKLQRDAVFSFTTADTDISIAPVGKVVNAHGSQYVEISFFSEIMPYISALKKCFTQYQLADVLKLKSRYAIVLYRWLMMSWRQYEHYVGTKERTPQQLVDYQNPRASLDELHRLTGTAKKYRDFRNFRKYVLDTAVDEITTKTGYAIAYEKVSSGRRVTGIIFHITNKRAPEPQPQSAAPQTEPAPQANPQIATQLFASPYTGMLMMAGLTDPIALTGDASYQRGLLERLYPAYDRFVGRFGQSALERHIKYVGAHTAQKPASLVPYMLKVLADYESQLEQASQKPGKRTGRAQINEQLPEWAAHPENVKAKKPSPEKLAKIDRMLAELEKDKNRQSDQEGAHR